MFGKLGWSQPVGSKQTEYKYNNACLPRAHGESINDQYLSNLKWNLLLKLCNTNLGSLGSFIAEHQQNLSLGYLVEFLYPALLITMANKDDTPTFIEAVIGPDTAGFPTIMLKEYTT